MKTMGGELKEFRFFIDEKVTMWRRHKYSVLADNYEDALATMEDSFDKGDYSGYFEDDSENINYLETEELYDTIEPINVIDNYGSPTLELFYQDRNTSNWKEKRIKTNLNQ